MLPSSLFAVAGGKPFVRILSKSDGGLSGERSQDVDVIYVASDFLVDDEIYNSIRLLFSAEAGTPVTTAQVRVCKGPTHISRESPYDVLY